ncbi:MAG: hypothetical protein K9W43_04015 [Candidatus Thorarchaeota archaeon]|nr:hypothetical protein [Candidatus Thorarchaeota archaeon]
MAGLENVLGYVMKIDFQFPMSDIIAVVPYVLPMLFIGATLLLYQRHLVPEAMSRNAMVFVGALCYILSFLLILYAGFGSVWWGPPELTFGSWAIFMGLLQATTDLIFGSVLGSVSYILLITVLFIFLAKSVIAPPNPDFVKIKAELRAAEDNVKTLTGEVQKLEGEKKQLTEFLSDKETTLTRLESELTSLKAQVAQIEEEKAVLQADLAAAKESPTVDADAEQELLATISKKDQTITRLQAEIEDLRRRAESAAPAKSTDKLAKIEEQLKSCQGRMESLARRSETASEVIDSVISDMAELISDIDSSGLDPSAKIALSSLLEGLGRAVGKISRPSEAPPEEEPRVELIGAVMMVHEVVDAVKRLARSASS